MLIALAIFGMTLSSLISSEADGDVAIGNTACAIAPSMNTLIAARAVAGMGGAGLATSKAIVTSPLTLSLIADYSLIYHR
jgi:MFS family permease